MDDPTRSVWAISKSRRQFWYPMLTCDRFTVNFREDMITERLKQVGLARSSFICDCSNQTTAVPFSDYRDEVVFQCYLSWRRKSAITGTCFARFRLRLRQIMIIVANWIVKALVTLAATFADVTKALAVQCTSIVEIYVQ